MFMDGTELLNELAHRITKRTGTRLTDAELARELGVTQPALGVYRGKELTPRKAANLIESFAKQAERRLMDNTLIPIVEFFPLGPVQTTHGKRRRIFSTEDTNGGSHPYLTGLRKRLEQAHGIYIFHDSRGRAIYAGKARQRPLWAEMNSAFNRDRGEVQNIKRVRHPTIRVEYRGLEEKKRQIRRRSVALHDIATYMSAYQVPDGLIGKFEALLVRSFANDLLNVRMENF
jgi:hypothetical protein